MIDRVVCVYVCVCVWCTRNEMMKKQCAACNLQPYEKDVILFLLYFTVTLAFSMLYKQWM